MPTCNDLVRAAVEADGRSLSEIARAAGFSKSGLWRIVRGEALAPTVPVIVAIAEALNRHPAELIPPGLSPVQVAAVRALDGDDPMGQAARLTSVLHGLLS